MRRRKLRYLVLLPVLFGPWVVVPGKAQTPRGPVPQQPTAGTQGQQTGQASQGEVVRQRLLGSGVPPAVIRARLRGAGYPSNLLDEYLVPDSISPAPPPPPDPLALQALQVLGLGGTTRADTLAAARDTVRLRRPQDSVRTDSLAQIEREEEEPPALQLFGLDVFQRGTTEFAPVVTGPVGDDYRLGPGDNLALIITGDVERVHALEVTRDGFVVIPRVGQIAVSNLTLGQLESVLYDRLGQVYSGISRGADARTRFQITVTRVRANTIRVIGEVERPGAYTITATGGVLAALYEAGGPTERGNLRAVEVRRGRELLGVVDLYDYLLSGVVPDEIRLGSGDVVFVPVRGARVKIAGEIARPAVYELRPGETMRDLLRFAGGLNPSAATVTATIDRILPTGERTQPGRTRTVLTVDLATALDPGSQAPALVAGDSVTIFPISGPRTNAVTVRGSVWQPGTYRLEEGMRLSDAIAVAGGLRPDTYGGRVQVLRTLPDSTRRLIGVALGGGDGPGSRPAEDLVLRESDEITVFSRTEFRPERVVTVHGAVQRPGEITFADSMTLRDAVMLAGGLRDDAYLAQAEISRPGVNGGDSLAVALRVPLDSSYIFDPTSYLTRPTGSRQSPEVLLHPYDNVFIRRQPNWELQRNVVITGEVRFPGRYTILSKDERLVDLIDRAGGLTATAYSNGIRFFREQDAAGRIPIDLRTVLNNPGNHDNILLVEGDSIYIPPYTPTVRVEGAVNAPSSVSYVEGRDTDYYVSAAGGYARQADKGKTYVQQPNGFVQEKNARPQPGAMIFVPARDPLEPRFNLTVLLGSVTGFLTSILALAAILTR